MILESTSVDSNFIYQFSKKFKTYCSKLPFFVSFHTTRQTCVLMNEDLNETYEYKFNLEKDVSQSIHDLRVWMIKYWHPRLYELADPEVPTSEEISEAIRNGKNIEDIDITKPRRYESIWIIDKVIIPKDTILLLKEGEYDFSWVYTLSMPSSIFLKNVREKWSNEEAWEMFRTKANFQYKSAMNLSINKVKMDEV